MYSQTVIGREIFAAIWGAVVLSATSEEIERLRFPFDPQLRRFVSSHDKDISAMWQAAQAFAGLSDDTMRIAADCAPWAGSAVKYDDLDMLKSELVLASRHPERFIGESEFQRITLDRDRVRQGCIDCLEQLLGALISSHWSFCGDAQRENETWPEFTRSLELVFLQLTPVVGGIKMGSDSILDLVFPRWLSSWRQEDHSLDEDAYRSYVEAWVDYMTKTDENSQIPH